MRGNPPHPHLNPITQGPIPAYAGEPSIAWALQNLPAAYPRVCGGTIAPNIYITRVKGLSPRMRGNPANVTANNASLGPIPAYAGEPKAVRSLVYQTRAYPRVCGGTFADEFKIPSLTGLSPRMRGNRCVIFTHGLLKGPIPAYAGEPF